jgi:pfkB family carbohydrate kinase
VHYAAVGAVMSDPQAGVELLHAAKQGGAMVTCDLIAPGPLAAAELKRILPHVDVFLPSAVEARYLTGQDDLHSAAQAFIDWGAAACVIKNGAEGAHAVDSRPAAAMVFVPASSPRGCAEGRGWRKAWPGSKATSAVCLVCGGGAVRRGRRLASVANALQRTDSRRYSDICSPIEDYCRRTDAWPRIPRRDSRDEHDIQQAAA